MKTANEIMEILTQEIEAQEKRWNYVFEHEEIFDEPEEYEREKSRALDEMTALKILFRKITGKGYNSTRKEENTNDSI